MRVDKFIACQDEKLTILKWQVLIFSLIIEHLKVHYKKNKYIFRYIEKQYKDI